MVTPTFIKISCDTWYKIIGALSVLGRAAVIGTHLPRCEVYEDATNMEFIIVTLIGRTSALYTLNRYVLVYLGALGAVCVGLDIVRIEISFVYADG